MKNGNNSPNVSVCCASEVSEQQNVKQLGLPLIRCVLLGLRINTEP